MPSAITALACTTLGTAVMSSLTNPTVFVCPALVWLRLTSLYPTLIPDNDLCQRASNTLANPLGYVLALISSCASPSATTTKSVYVPVASPPLENVTLPTFDMEGAVLTQRLKVRQLRASAIQKITSI